MLMTKEVITVITKMWIVRHAKDNGYSRPETLKTFSDVVNIPRKGDILKFRGPYEYGQQTVTHVVWEESPVGDGFHEVTVYTRDTESRDYEY